MSFVLFKMLFVVLFIRLCTVYQHTEASPKIDMSLHLDTLCWYRDIVLTP